MVSLLVSGSRWYENVKQTVTLYPFLVHNLSRNSGWEQQNRRFETDSQIVQNPQCRRTSYALGHKKRYGLKLRASDHKLPRMTTSDKE